MGERVKTVQDTKHVSVFYPFSSSNINFGSMDGAKSSTFSVSCTSFCFSNHVLLDKALKYTDHQQKNVIKCCKMIFVVYLAKNVKIS